MSFCQFIYLFALLSVYLFVLLSQHRSHLENRQAPEEHRAAPWLPEAGRFPLQGEQQQQPHSRAQQLPPRGEIPQEPSAAASAAGTPAHPLLTDSRIPTAADTRRQRCGPSCGAQLRPRAAPGLDRAGLGRVGPPAALATVARGGPVAKRAPHSTSGAPLPPSASPTARGDGFRGGGGGGDALRGSRGPGAAPPGQARARRLHRHREGAEASSLGTARSVGPLQVRR